MTNKKLPMHKVGGKLQVLPTKYLEGTSCAPKKDMQKKNKDDKIHMRFKTVGSMLRKEVIPHPSLTP